MLMPQSFIRGVAGTFLSVSLSIILQGEAVASDNERYKAVPLGPNGAAVLILDTREGDMWTWTNQGKNAEPSGKNPQIRFQGNLRKNMRSPITSSDSPPQSDERY